MSGFAICTAVLLVGGLAPALVVASRSSAASRLVGVELVAAVATVALLLISQVVHQSYDLIVPLVLVPLSFAGTLVFTRLVKKPDDGA